jgi:hypothetical protein
MTKLIAYCRSRGTSEIVGEALAGNADLLNLAKRFGFDVQPFPDNETMTLRLDLRNGVPRDLQTEWKAAAPYQ